MTLVTGAMIAAVSLAGQIAPSSAGSRTVALEGIAFSPKSLAIRVGTTVTFAFLDPDTEHNVISRGSKRFKSVGTRSSGSVKRTFRRGGVYRYECTLHPGMTGRISVR